MAVLALVALAAGAAAAATAATWPRLDPGAPHLSVSGIRGSLRRHPRLAAAMRRRTDPAALTGVALAATVVVAALTVGIVGALLVMVRTETGLWRTDLPLATWAAAATPGPAADVVRLVTRLGDVSVVIAAAAVAGLVEGHRLGRHRSVLGFLTLAVGGQFALVWSVKLVVGRARPDLEPLAAAAGASFPSGHAAAAATGWACVALLVGAARSSRVRTAAVGVATGAAAAVAVSRVLLGVHWLTDVVAGLALGWGWFALVSVAFGGRSLRFGLPVARAEDEAARVVPDETADRHRDR